MGPFKYVEHVHKMQRKYSKDFGKNFSTKPELLLEFTLRTMRAKECETFHAKSHKLGGKDTSTQSTCVEKLRHNTFLMNINVDKVHRWDMFEGSCFLNVTF